MRKGPMPIEKHAKNANDLAAAWHYLTKVVNRCEKYYPKNNAIIKLLAVLSPITENGNFQKLQDQLNKQYKKDIGLKELRPDEEIYKNLHERYKKLRNIKDK